MDIAELRKQAQGYLAAAKAATDPEEADQHLAKYDETKAQIDRVNRVRDAEAFMNEPVTQPVTHIGGSQEESDQVDPQSWRELKLWEHTPFQKTYRYWIPENVMRDGRGHYDNGKAYKSAFEAYLRKGRENMGPEDLKTLTEGSDTAGGFLFDEDYQTGIIMKTAMQARFRALASVMTTNSNLVQFPKVTYSSGTNDTDGKIFTTGARITWTGEQPASATTSNVTNPVFGLISIPVHTAMARLPLSNDLIEDRGDLLGWCTDMLGETFALDEDNVFLNGSGSGRPTGLLTEINGNGPAYVVTGTQNALTTSGDAHSGLRINTAYYTVPAQYRSQGTWMMTSLTLEAVDNLVDGQKRPIVGALTNISMANAEPQTLKGKSIVVDEFMPELAASTDTDSIIFGDFKGYQIVDRVGISVQRLTELYAETNITVLLARRRVGGYCIRPERFISLRAAAS